MLHMNLMVITNQKSILDKHTHIHTKERKESKCNTKDSHQKKEQKTTNTTRKQ